MRPAMEQTVTIEKFVHGGLGLARTEKGVLFVSDVVPGEKVRVIARGSIGGQNAAQPLEIIDRSPHRRKPACAYFGICGGCDWLHCSYERQLSAKEEIVAESFARIGKIRDLPRMEIFPSPEFGYRQRVQLKIDTTCKIMGFYKRKSRDIVPISFCPLLRPGLNTLLTRQREIAELAAGGIDQIKCIAGTRGSIASSPALIPLTSAETTLRTGDVSFVVSGDCFFQGNVYLCEKLGSWAKDSIEGEHVVDLYGGVGFFSAFLHKRFKTGTLVDNVEKHIVLAKRNFEANGITNLTCRLAYAEDFLRDMRGFAPRTDCLVVDPPRMGLSPKTRHAVCRYGPARILYVSCDPATQARDIGFLIITGKYVLKKIALFDLYPNTHHMETVVLLEKTTV